MTPQPGDLIVFGDEHVGIVRDVLPNGDIATIEGNYENKVAANVRTPDRSDQLREHELSALRIPPRRVSTGCHLGIVRVSECVTRARVRWGLRAPASGVGTDEAGNSLADPYPVPLWGARHARVSSARTQAASTILAGRGARV